MFVNTFFRRVLFNVLCLSLIFFINFFLFKDIYTSNEIIFSFAVHPFNICERYSKLWYYIKLIYIPIVFISSIIFINIIYSVVFTKKIVSKNISSKKISNLNLKVFNENNSDLIISESGLYQNFLVTGTIGSGKTSSIMYPFTKQLIKFSNKNPKEKLGMLILDVKGNYYSQVKKYADYFGRSEDLIVIEIRSEV